MAWDAAIKNSQSWRAADRIALGARVQATPNGNGKVSRPLVSCLRVCFLAGEILEAKISGSNRIHRVYNCVIALNAASNYHPACCAAIVQRYRSADATYHKYICEHGSSLNDNDT